MVTDFRDIYRYKETAWTIFIWLLKFKKKKKKKDWKNYFELSSPNMGGKQGGHSSRILT